MSKDKLKEELEKRGHKEEIKADDLEDIAFFIDDMRLLKNIAKEFRRLLKTENIDAIFRINPIGRIYGVTFIDHNAGIVANGSVLGKEFSANVFNDLYPAPKEECQVAEQRYPERKLDPQSHTTNPLTEAADTLLDLADTKAYEEQQRIIQRRKNENRINNILFIV